MTKAITYSDYLFKILFVGDSAVGKSCLILKFCDDVFQENFISTVGVDFKIKTVEVGGKRVKLQIWDTAGQERFRTITTAYFRSANAVFLTYDITSIESFEHVSSWLQQIQSAAPVGVTTILIGNKCDLTEQRKIPTDRARRLANESHMKFYETSAKTGTNVERAFVETALHLASLQVKHEQQAANSPVKLGKTQSKNKKTNCNC